MPDVGRFGRPKFTFYHISGHFRSIRNFNFFEIFDKMAAVGHFGCPKFTLDHISGHFISINNFSKFKSLKQWPKITLYRISYHFRCIFILGKMLYKMAAAGHFGCPKITFGRISGHFRSIRNFFLNYFYKMAAGGHFGCP